MSGSVSEHARRASGFLLAAAAESDGIAELVSGQGGGPGEKHLAEMAEQARQQAGAIRGMAAMWAEMAELDIDPALRARAEQYSE